MPTFVSTPTAPNMVPAGGTTGQVLTKTAATDYALAWATAAGGSLHSGTGAPAGTVGKDGDFYIDQDTSTLYGPKAAGTWPPGTSLIGPQGPAGMSQGQYAYRWSNNTAATDPTHGSIKADNADPAAFTKLYVSAYSRTDQVVLALGRLVADDEVIVYETGEFNTWNSYQLTGAPVDNGDEWFELPVAFLGTGTLPFTPNNGDAVDLVVPTRGEPGPPGPDGAPGSKGDQGDPGGQYPYNWLTSNTVADPGHGALTGNAPGDITFTNVLSVSAYSDTGQEVLDFGRLFAQSLIYIYDHANLSGWASFRANAPSTDHGEWFEIPVSFNGFGPMVFDGNTDTAVDLVLQVSGQPAVGIPAGGTGGQVLIKGSEWDYDAYWADAGGGGADDALVVHLAGDETITGSKTFTQPLTVGVDPAETGLVRVPNLSYFMARKADNSADISMLGLNEYNQIVIGAETAANIFLAKEAQIADGQNLVFGTATGTKIGADPGQRLAFWNTAPITQPANTVAIDTLLANVGLRAAGGAANFATNISAPNLKAAAFQDVGTAAGTVAAGNDPRFGAGGPPSGPAGGVLSGTYPDPGFASDMATQAEMDAALATKATDSLVVHLAGAETVTGVKTFTPGILIGADVTLTRQAADVLRIADGTWVGKGSVHAVATGTDFYVAGEGNKDQFTHSNLFVAATSGAVLTANQGGSIALGGPYSAGGLNNTPFARIAGVKENSTAEDYAGALTFWTRPMAGNMTERLRISSTGAVTIPGSLTVTGTIAASNLGAAAFMNVGIAAGTVAAGDDPRFGAAPPTGPAGGVLSGSFPNPSFAAPILGADQIITSTGWGNLGIATTDAWAIDKGATIVLGGTVTGTTRSPFGAIKGVKENNVDGNTGGNLVFAVRTAGNGPMVERMRIASASNEIRVADGATLTSIGTGGLIVGGSSVANDKLGFFGKSPIVKPANTVAIDDVLINLGLRVTGGVANFTREISTGSGAAQTGQIRIPADTMITSRNASNGDNYLIYYSSTQDTVVLGHPGVLSASSSNFSVGYGSNSAATGNFRLPYVFAVTARNNAKNGDLTLLNSVGASDVLQIGSTFKGCQFPSSAVGVTPVAISGFASQTANLTEWRTSVAAVLLAVAADGSLVSNTNLGIKIGTTSTQKLGFFGVTTPIARPAVSGFYASDADNTIGTIKTVVANLLTALVNLGLISVTTPVP